MSPVTGLARVTGTNSVVCSYGKFQPGRPGWIQETATKTEEHKLVLFATVIALWTLVTLLIELIRSLTSKVEIYTRPKLCHFCRYVVRAKLFCLKSFAGPGHRAGVFIFEIFISVTEISVAKTEISVTGPVRPLIWTHRYFYKEKSGQARSRKPNQPGRPGSYEEALKTGKSLAGSDFTDDSSRQPFLNFLWVCRRSVSTLLGRDWCVACRIFLKRKAKNLASHLNLACQLVYLQSHFGLSPPAKKNNKLLCRHQQLWRR